MNGRRTGTASAASGPLDAGNWQNGGPGAISNRPTSICPTSICADVAGVHEEIASLVAGAFEAGGPAWAVTAPLVETLVGPGWAGAAPVVLVRALAREQRRQADEAARLLAAGDEDSARALLDRLRGSCERVVRVLGR